MSALSAEQLSWIEARANERSRDVARIEVTASVFDSDGNWVDDFYLAKKHIGTAIDVVLLDGEPTDA